MNEKYTFITEEASKQNRTILKSEDRYNHKYNNPEFRPNAVHFLIAFSVKKTSRRKNDSKMLFLHVTFAK